LITILIRRAVSAPILPRCVPPSGGQPRPRRKPARRQPAGPAERLADSARNGARLAGRLDWTGAVEVGKAADAVLPDPVAESGFGDIQVFDLVSFKTSWGRLGVGPILVFPTAASDAPGVGKYQAGPAVAAIHARGRLTAGAIPQNPISFAGDPDRPEVNQLVVAPTLTITFGQGWFAGLSDFNWTFDWERHGAALIPAGAQFGKVVTLGRQPVTLAPAGSSKALTRMTQRPGPPRWRSIPWHRSKEHGRLSRRTATSVSPGFVGTRTLPGRSPSRWSSPAMEVRPSARSRARWRER
jgi:hypothetical protein